jgi:hypothetical protein
MGEGLKIFVEIFTFDGGEKEEEEEISGEGEEGGDILQDLSLSSKGEILRMVS